MNEASNVSAKSKQKVGITTLLVRRYIEAAQSLDGEGRNARKDYPCMPVSTYFPYCAFDVNADLEERNLFRSMPVSARIRFASLVELWLLMKSGDLWYKGESVRIGSMLMIHSTFVFKRPQHRTCVIV